MKKYVLIFVMLLACFAGLNCGAESKCDAGSLDFQTEHVYLKEGKTVIEGTFYNKGDIGTRVTKAELSVDANDMAGNLLRSASCVFSNVNAWVPAHGNKSWTFIITDSTAQEYSRKFKWNVKINYSYSNDNKPTVTPITSNAGKPAANSGQPQKLTDVNAIARFLLNGEFEVVEVGKHPEYGDVWAEALGAIVRFEHPNDENMPGGIALDIIGASVIKSPSGTTHFTHKADSHPYGDWLFDFFGSTDINKSEIVVYRWVDDGSLAYNDVCGWGRGNEIRYNYSIDGNYLTIWRDVGTEEMPIRGENAFVLKKIN